MRGCVLGLRLFSFLLLLGLLVAGCSNMPLSERREKNAEKADTTTKDIIIGAASPWGEKRNLLAEGIELAVSQINGAGGLLAGRKISIVWGDDQRSVKQGQIVAQEFSENTDMIAVIGHSNSSVSVPASIMYQYNGLLMLSPLSTSSRLTAHGYNLIFRNIPNDALLGVKAAGFCQAIGLKKMMIYYVNDEFGQGQSNAFELKAEELGVKILDRLSYDAFTTSAMMTQDLIYWKESYDFDAIFLAGLMPKAAEVIKAARKAGIDQPIVGGDGLDHPMLFSIAGKDAENVYTATVFAKEFNAPEIQNFMKEFQKTYGKDPDIAAAQGYDAVRVLAAGIAQAGSTVPHRIAEALHDLKGYEGLTGEYSFDKNGDVLGRQVIIKVVKNGNFELVQ